MNEGLLFVHGIPAEDVEREARPLPGPSFLGIDCTAVAFARMETIRVRARNALAMALRSGKVTRPTTCARCPSTGPLHGHHADYSRPLDVEWLCTECHRLETRAITKQARENLNIFKGRPAWLRGGGFTRGPERVAAKVMALGANE